MSGQSRATPYFWAGLISILALYCLYNFYFNDVLYLQIPLKARHIGKFIFISLAYVIGLLTLKRQAPNSWVIRIWHIVYGGILLLLLIAGVYDWVVARTPVPLRIIAYDLEEFLVSPILYGVLGLISKRFAVTS